MMTISHKDSSPALNDQRSDYDTGISKSYDGQVIAPSPGDRRDKMRTIRTRKSHRPIACPLCGNFYFRASLPFHVKACASKHPELASRPVQCPVCGITVRAASELYIHLRSECKGGKSATTDKTLISTYPFNPPPSSYHDPPYPLVRSSTTDQRMTGLRSSTTDQRMTDLRSSTTHQDLMDTSSFVRCRVCGRTFFPERVKRHEEICEKVKAWEATSHRWVYDTVWLRMKGIAEENGWEVPPLPPKGRAYVLITRTRRLHVCTWHTNWRMKHEELLRIVREARRAYYMAKRMHRQQYKKQGGLGRPSISNIGYNRPRASTPPVASRGGVAWDVDI